MAKAVSKSAPSKAKKKLRFPAPPELNQALRAFEQKQQPWQETLAEMRREMDRLLAAREPGLRSSRAGAPVRRPLTDKELAALTLQQQIFLRIVNRILPGEALYATSAWQVHKQIKPLWNEERTRLFGADCRESMPHWTTIKTWLQVLTRAR
jgi:hypothetical protein